MKVVLASCGALGVLATWQPALAADDNRVDIQAVVTETYDSNVADADALGAAERGVTPQDEIFEPSIAIDLLLPVSRQALFLNGSVGYDFYTNNHILDSGRVDLNGGARLHLARCQGKIADDVVYAQSSLQYLSLAVTRNAETDEGIELDASCGGQIGLAPTLSVSEHWTNNSSPELITSDYTAFDLKTGLAYRQPRFGEVSTYFSFDQSEFPNRDLLLGPASIQDGYKAYGVGIQYDRRIGAKIEGTVRVAYQSVRPDATTTAGYQGVTYGADVTFHFSRLLQAKLSLQRGVNPTIQPNVTYELDTSYGLEADYTPGRKLKFTAGVSGGSDRYYGADLQPTLDISSQTVWAVRGSVSYQLNRRFGFEIDATHEARDANLSIFSYSDDRVGLALKAAI